MDPKLLTENHWKTNSVKCRIKDNDLHKALASYDKLDDDDEYEDLLEGITKIKKAALALKKSKEVSANPAATKYVNDIIAAAEEDYQEICKAKVEFDKEEASQKKEGGNAPIKSEDDDDDDAEFEAALLGACKKLVGSKDLVYEFIVCEGKPHPAIMIAKRITAKHKEQLAEVTGNKRFPHTGTCRSENGKLVFEMEKPSAGLAIKFQNAIHGHTGKKFSVIVGGETAAEEEGSQPHGAAEAPKMPKPELANAPKVWLGACEILHKRLSLLKSAIISHCSHESPALIAEVNKDMEKMSAKFGRFDRKLADSMAKAVDAKDAASRTAELQNCKAIIADCIKYVKSEPLIAHVDANPFGVKTDLAGLITSAVTHAAQSLGKVG